LHSYFFLSKENEFKGAIEFEPFLLPFSLNIDNNGVSIVGKLSTNTPIGKVSITTTAPLFNKQHTKLLIRNKAISKDKVLYIIGSNSIETILDHNRGQTKIITSEKTMIIDITKSNLVNINFLLKDGNSSPKKRHKNKKKGTITTRANLVELESNNNFDDHNKSTRIFVPNNATVNILGYSSRNNTLDGMLVNTMVR
jgi:hypothetical protein